MSVEAIERLRRWEQNGMLIDIGELREVREAFEGTREDLLRRHKDAVDRFERLAEFEREMKKWLEHYARSENGATVSVPVYQIERLLES